MKEFIYAAGLMTLLFSQVSQANTLIMPGFFEPNLIGAGGILDSEFGSENLQRINDDLDQYWNVTTDQVTVTAVAKYAGFSQNFGFIDSSDNFTSLLHVPYMGAQTGTFSLADPALPFRFGLDPDGSPLFSSDPADNISCGWFFCSSHEDHMVSWLITDGLYAGDYILAWEDLKFLGDRDYNDLVLRVSGVSIVPVPTAAWLFISGLFALITVSRRRRV
ncbi:MAG: hypothetical protein RQ982_12350 [Gammaproteobacteria bacterium]|nr:hypothetical protein [Gammaproteobacteria bacterium]